MPILSVGVHPRAFEVDSASGGNGRLRTCLAWAMSNQLEVWPVRRAPRQKQIEECGRMYTMEAMVCMPVSY